MNNIKSSQPTVLPLLDASLQYPMNVPNTWCDGCSCCVRVLVRRIVTRHPPSTLTKDKNLMNPQKLWWMHSSYTRQNLMARCTAYQYSTKYLLLYTLTPCAGYVPRATKRYSLIWLAQVICDHPPSILLCPADERTGILTRTVKEYLVKVNLWRLANSIWWV